MLSNDLSVNKIIVGTSSDNVSNTISDGGFNTAALCIVGKGTSPQRRVHIWDQIILGSSDNVSNTISDGGFDVNALCIVGKGTGPNRTIHMWDNVIIENNLNVSGTITTNRAVCTSSDRRLKQNIKELDCVYDSIKKLTPVTYEWKDDNKNDFGLIAQEYYEIFPFTNKSELIGEEPVDETGNPKYYSVDYSKLSVILLQGLKETMIKLEETTLKLDETTNNLNNQILYTNKLENIINERLNKLENI